MSETTTTEGVSEQTGGEAAAQAARPPVTETEPQAPQPAQNAAPRPRIPRPHCAC